MNIGRKEYTLLWFIENYSYYSHKNGELLASPTFTINGLEKTSWVLWLYVRGQTANKCHISINLFRLNDVGPDDIFITYEFSIIAKDGSVLMSKEDEYKFEKGIIHGFEEFLDIEEVLFRRNADFLPQDILNVRCKIWFGEGNIHTVGQYSARTIIGIEKISFLHKVENFSALEPNEKNTLQFQSDSDTGFAISSHLYFTDILFPEGTIIFETVPSDRKYSLSKKKIWLLDGSGKVIECCEADNRFDTTRKEIQKLPLSLTRKAILNKKSEYLPNDELSLLCECTFSTGVEFKKIVEIHYDKPIVASIKQGINTETNEKSYNIPERLSACPSAMDDLKTIYSNKSLTDVEIKTKTKSFPAHKLVLCARSSVFKTMLTSDMKEKNTNCIQVDDLDDDILQQLLLFLYSDDLENLQWESAIKLYYAGDKYAIEKLKLMCSSFLVHNLTTSTASELLLLADTHNDCDLKNFVEDFILEYEEDVFGSDEWEKLIESNPQLVIKTMHLKYKRKKGGK